MKLIFKERFLMLLLLTAITTTVFAQRFTDNLNRGLVAVQHRKGTGMLVSWRIQPYEYYDVTYNLYKNNAKVASNLNTSNYWDLGGTPNDTYMVKAVVNGVEQNPEANNGNWKNGATAATYFATNRSTYASGAPGYLRIPMEDVVDRDGNVVFYAKGSGTNSQNYSLNDVSLADLDGDGEIEIIVKRINETDATADNPEANGVDIYKYGQKAFTIFEAYKLDGTRLWWIDCGPNMVSLNSTEINAVAYDWDEDGKAEVLLRGVDNMIVHTNDNQSILIGNEVDLRNAILRTEYKKTQKDEEKPSQFAWTRVGKEYLLFLNGATGMPYVASGKSISSVSGKPYGLKYTPEDFPLKRVEDTSVTEITTEAQAAQSQDESSNSDLYKYLKALNTEWGDSYGHRCNKFFLGAPFLDGRKASVFLARGIYTRIKMAALDVDFNQNNGTYSVTSTKTWNNSTAGSPWYGQGNHNFSIADVDGDGCDEIIYGSMTIDNNMKGLSTTGLGHGDAIHVGDFDPFRKGLEVFACNEDNPGSNYRDATTSEILYRQTASGDDGRAMMGNFIDEYPGCTGRSVSSGVISATSKKAISGMAAESFIPWGQLNARIYWDGDLLEEFFCNSSGNKDQAGVVSKIGYARIAQTDNTTISNNDTKKNACAQGDIIGDWREEFIMRSSDNKELRVYSTDEETQWRIPSLWYDHEYRQAMVWQMCAYNQPPHTSFFLGELEGITRAPLPLTMSGRTELKSGNITTAHNDQVVLICNSGNYGIDTSNSPSPKMIVVNSSSTVSGNNDSNVSTKTAPSYSYNTIYLGSGSNGQLKADGMRLIKQGDGIFKLCNRTHEYSGDTEIWGGTFQFRGTLSKSNVWMNRHTTFECGGTISKSLTMEYGATLSYPMKESTNYYSATISTLNMHEGSRLVLQRSGTDKDNINITDLNIRKRTESNWKQYGPKYLAPVFEIKPQSKLAAGRYKIGTITNITGGTIDDIIPECNNTVDNAIIYLEKDEVTNEVFMVIEEGIDPNKSYTETVTEHNVVSRTYRLDFETENTEFIDGVATATNAKYGFDAAGVATPAKSTVEEYTNNKNNHFLHGAMLASDAGARKFCKSFSGIFDGIVAAGETSYTFSFDMALIKSSVEGSKLTVYSDASNALFTVEVGSSNTATIKKADGTSFSKTVNVEAYQSNNDCQPEEQYYYTYIITGTYSNGNGNVKLTVKKRNDNSIIINNEVIITSFKVIDRIFVEMPRYYGHVGFDNFTLNASTDATITTTTTTTWTEVDLSETVAPRIPAGTYDKLNVTRSNFKSGYNTFCIPMNTTAAEVAGSGAKAYKFSRVEGNNSTAALIFEEVSEIEANKPYLIYVDNAVAIPTVFNNVTVSVAKPVTVEADGWKFISNYEPGKSMNGNYMVYNNENGGQLRQGGKNATLNGLRAYFVAPAAANAKTLVLSFDETTGIVNTIIANDEVNGVAGIYSISGIPQKALGNGINIVKMSNGSVKKIYIK